MHPLATMMGALDFFEQHNPNWERREHLRLPVHFPILLDSNVDCHMGASLDLSESGMAVCVPAHVDAGSVVVVHFEIPGGGELSCEAEVMRNDHAVLGLRFIGLESEHAETLALYINWLDALSRAPSAAN